MFLGFIAIGLLIQGEHINACWIILIAGAMDALDGKLARLLGLSSRFGTEFDSFADTISFVVAPAVLVYTTWVTDFPLFFAIIISFIPLLFGTIRLARFNLMQLNERKSYFTGLTTPLNAITIFGFLLFNYHLFGTVGDQRIALILVFVLGALMVSPVRFGTVPLLSLKQGRKNNLRLVAFILTGLAVLLSKGVVLFPLLIIYIVWNTVNWIMHPHVLDDIPTVREKEV
jgi:CDP-diacylglycerol--serine O-phosphatidyltransferase